MIFKFVVLGIVGIALSSCHPADNGTSSSPLQVEQKNVAFKGLLVDGYIANADVCLAREGEEVCTKSDENGSYEFEALSFAPNATLMLVATGGTDTASQKPYSGTLYEHIDLSDIADGATIERNITPLSDLVALLSMGTELTMSQAQALLAQIYAIAPEQANADPMRDNALFAVSQDIEQSKALLAVMADKLHTDSLEQAELENIRKDIREALANSVYEKREFSLYRTIELLEKNWQKSVPVAHKIYVIAQRENIYDSLQNFAASGEHSVQERADFQKRLVDDVDKALKSFEELEDDKFLMPKDILASEPDEPTDPTDTNASDENNQTAPEPAPTFTITGRMVDGYISGATVCIDTNADAKCDLSEPRTATLADGSFSFALQSLEAQKYYRVIGFGGKDSATQKDFAGEYLGVLSTYSQSSNLLLTPMNDLVARMFFRSETLSATALDFAQNAIAQSMGVNSADLNRDPMSLKNLMLASTGVESIYAVLSSVLKSHLDAQSLTSRQKSIARESMLEEFLDSGYSSFAGSRAVIRMELKLGIAISNALHEFARDQIKENLLKLNNLNYPNSIERDAFENVQRIFDRELALALQTNSYREINANVELILHSKFDKTGALFDKNACLQNETYSNAHAQTRDAQRYIDVSNGIIMGFVTTEENSHKSFTLFYPPLGDVTKSDVLVRFESDYFFSYDAAWIETGKSVYLETLSANDVTKCYAIELNKLYGSDLRLQPVFRYTDAP